MKLIEETKKILTSNFEMKDLGILRYILGMEIEVNPGESIRISQKKYIQEILQRFQMEDSKGVETPSTKYLREGSPVLPTSPTQPYLQEEKVPWHLFPTTRSYKELVGSLNYLV